jgi:hypothetical protein
MLIKHIYATWPQLKSLATREVYDLAFASEAIISLHVMPILQFHLGALFDCRIVKRKTYTVCGNDQPLTVPTFPTNVSRGSNGQIDVTY